MVVSSVHTLAAALFHPFGYGYRTHISRQILSNAGEHSRVMLPDIRKVTEELLIGGDQLHSLVAASRGGISAHPTERFRKANLALGK